MSFTLAMRYSFLIIIYVVLSGTAFGQDSLKEVLDRHNSHSIPYISIEELEMLHPSTEIVILDAREKGEFEVSRIPKAKHIGFDRFSPTDRQLQKINKDSPIIVYCSIGVRSEKIAERLKKEGFTNVKNLYGGIFEWKNKGFKVVDSTQRHTENVHVFSKKWSKWLQVGNPIY